MKNYIFSYGTLIDKFPVEKKRGFLINNYKLGSYGSYPALIKDKKIHKIKGFLLELSDNDFKNADSYEGYPFIYDRVELDITLDKDLKKKAWVYILKEDK
jgi:gamma-glutamylcyclotransferase (GGCT)/AIG2-like uncharacterized protein YtfP